MTYDEACEKTLTREEVIAEMDRHHIDIDDKLDFFEKRGYKPEYTGQEVLDWLGY